MTAQNLDLATLRHLFPFHMEIGEGLRLCGIGESLSRIIGAAAVDDALSEFFSIDRPRGIETVQDLISFAEMPIYLTYHKAAALGLKGQVIALDGDKVFLVCSPLVRDVEAVAPLGLTFADFARYDVAADFIMMMETQAALQEDLERSASHLETARDRALQASKAKSAFLAGASHELRTPLNAILGFSEMMTQAADSMDRADIEDYANCIFTSGHHLLAIINDILDLSKVESGKFELNEETVDLRDIISICAHETDLQAKEKEIRFEIDMPHPVPVHCDVRLIRQVVLNLLSNAIKFTPQNGWVGLSLITSASGADIIVADNGIGIGDDEKERLFEPFAQADPSITRRFGGTGLGLTISREIARLHGGELTLHSTQGDGTSVRLSIPADRLIRQAANG